MDETRATTDSNPANPGGTPSFRYRAFISYSHRDEKTALWLHRELETYAIPKSLAGKPGRDGPIPRRITPIFRDRDELPASADLGMTLRQALMDSAILIVLCSPEAARSHWVNEEVMEFKRLGRTARVLAVIVRGEPHGSGEECFPPALRFTMAADGSLTSIPAEPIAPDLRPGGDGRERVKLKVVAGILGVPFDVLFAREQRRRKRRRWLATGVVALLTAGFLGTWQWGQMKLARQKQEAADRLARETAERQRQKTHFEADAKAEEGRLALLAGNPSTAEPALAQAHALWPDDATRLMRDVARRDLSGLKGVWAGHSGGILRLATTRDGSRALSIGEEGTAIVWDVAKGTLLHRLGDPVGQARGFSSGAFSPDGQWAMVLRTYGEGVVLLNLATGDQRNFPGVAGAAFAADGRLAVTLRDFKTPGRFGWITPATGAFTDGPVLPLPCEYVEAADRDGHTAVFNARVDRDAHHGWIDLATGAVLADLPGNRGYDDGPALSPDGSRLAVATKDGFEVRTREGVVGKLVATQPVSESSLIKTGVVPFRVRWADGGRLLVSTNQGATCSVWDADGKWLRSWPSDGIPEMEADPEEAVAAFTSENGRVELRKLQTGEILTSFSDTIGRRAHRDMTTARTTSVHFLPHSLRLLSAWESSQVKVWAWKEAQPAVRLLRGHNTDIASLAWSGDGRTLASSGQDGRVLLWEAGTGARQTEIHVSTKPGIGAAGAAFGPGEAIYSLDSLGQPAAWLRNGQGATLAPAPGERRTENNAPFQQTLDDIRAAASDLSALGDLAPMVVDDQLLTAARGDREIVVRDLKARSFRPALATGGGRLRDCATSGNLALLADDTGTVTGVEISTARRVFAVRVSDKPLRVVRATQGAGFATVDREGHAAAFSFEGKPLGQVTLEKVKFNDAFLSSDAQWLYLAGDDGKVLHRPVSESGAMERWTDSVAPPADGLPPMPSFGEAKKGVLRLALSRDGKYLAASLEYGAICLWETSTGRLLYRCPGERAEILEFSPDNRWLAAGSTSGLVSLIGLGPP